jgi:hypothetical protein
MKLKDILDQNYLHSVVKRHAIAVEAACKVALVLTLEERILIFNLNIFKSDSY